MLEIINNHCKANTLDLQDRVLQGPSLAQQDLHLLSQLKGQILAMQEMLDIKTYLIEAVEMEEADEVSSIRTSSIVKS